MRCQRHFIYILYLYSVYIYIDILYIVLQVSYSHPHFNAKKRVVSLCSSEHGSCLRAKLVKPSLGHQLFFCFIFLNAVLGET